MGTRQFKDWSFPSESYLKFVCAVEWGGGGGGSGDRDIMPKLITNCFTINEPFEFQAFGHINVQVWNIGGSLLHVYGL